MIFGWTNLSKRFANLFCTWRNLTSINDHFSICDYFYSSNSLKSTSMRAYRNNWSVYSNAQWPNEQARQGKLGQNMPRFSSSDPGLSLSLKIRPCHTCGIISRAMTLPIKPHWDQRETLHPGGRVRLSCILGSWRRSDTWGEHTNTHKRWYSEFGGS